MVSSLANPLKVERRTGVTAALAVVLLTVAGLAATLPGVEFSNGGENLLVTTALETRRSGRWLIPTMNNAPRVNKPPLPMWLSAVGITDDTLAGVGNPDREVRERALATLNWQVRWPALLASGLTLLAVFRLGRTLGGRDPTVGWMAAAICASEVLFLRHARLATTDVQLMLWAAVANLCLARLLLDGHRWWMAVAVGVAIGLGLMSKGPVVLVQTLAPAVAMIGWDRWRRASAGPSRLGPVGVALLVGLAIAGPWFVYVWLRVPGVAEHWWVETTRNGATEQSADAWFGYLSFLPLLAPWTGFFLVGLVATWRDRQSPDNRGWMLAVLMTLVPIVLMSFFSDRKSRYLLPMAIPAAVVAARGVIVCLSLAKGRWVVIAHWAVVGVPAIGFLIAAAVGIGGRQWLGWATAVPAMLAVAGAIALAWRRDPAVLMCVTFAIMTLLHVLFMHGYRDSDRGRSEMKPLAEQIWAAYPNAHVRVTGTRRTPIPPDLPLYLNRSVQWLPSLDRLKIGNEPCVLVTRQRKDDPPPIPPPGWTALEPVRRDSTLWHAWVLVPGK